MRNALPFLGAIAIAYLVLCAWVFVTQRSQIYFPTSASDHAIGSLHRGQRTKGHS